MLFLHQKIHYIFSRRRNIFLSFSQNFGSLWSTSFISLSNRKYSLFKSSFTEPPTKAVNNEKWISRRKLHTTRSKSLNYDNQTQYFSLFDFVKLTAAAWHVFFLISFSTKHFLNLSELANHLVIRNCSTEE